jgi:hypothetical protein
MMERNVFVRYTLDYFKDFIVMMFIYLKNVVVRLMVMVVMHLVNVFTELVIQMQQM